MPHDDDDDEWMPLLILLGHRICPGKIMPTDEKFKAFVEWKRPKNTSATGNLNKWKQTQGNGRFKASNNGQVKSWRNSQHDGFKSKKGKNDSEKGGYFANPSCKSDATFANETNLRGNDLHDKTIEFNCNDDDER